MSGISIVIEREYLERVRKKSFIITTILVPLLIVAAMLLPAILVEVAGDSKSTYIVIDRSGAVIENLKDTDAITFVPTHDFSVDSALAVPDVDGVLVIPAGIITARKDATLKLYNHGPSSMSAESAIRGQINSIIEQQRLHSYDIPDLDRILRDSKADVSISTVRVTDGEAEGESTSPILSYVLGMGMAFTLYMFILIYGQMVMTSIIEEKGNRVLEVVVSSVRPVHLMLGKIIGVGLVALTQILLWAAIISVVSFVVLPTLLPADIMAEASSGKIDPDIATFLTSLPSASTIAGYMVLMVVFLVLGFLIYSSIFAAIGSAVDNIQDASQLSSLAVFPIVFGCIFATVAAAEPSGSIAFWASIFPLTSPMVMVARIPFGIPGWEIAVSLALLVAGLLGMAWIAGKIYRVGIFMYGKKPTFREIMRWISYK